MSRLGIMALLLLLPGLSMAGQASVEQKIKAAYLYNFTKFIAWPGDDSETFNLCLLGEDAVARLLAPLEKKTAMGLPIHLQHLQRPEQAGSCHILYLAAADGAWNTDNLALQGVLTISSGSSALTVSGEEGFARQGGMIGFVVRKGKVRLQINLQALKNSGLKVSAKLLEVAEIIDGAEQ
ncbi:YfiR family protein [Thiolapillus sp.]|uniref:YfiR family protein n=1 Tax=Thiolapillus sp. TaxID=2017437 RepID=UPI003AF66E21